MVAQFLAPHQALERVVRPPQPKFAKVDGAGAGWSGTSLPACTMVVGTETPNVTELVRKIESNSKTISYTEFVAISVDDAAVQVSHCSGDVPEGIGERDDRSEVEEDEGNSDLLVEDGEDIDPDDILSTYGEFDKGGSSNG